MSATHIAASSWVNSEFSSQATEGPSQLNWDAWDEAHQWLNALYSLGDDWDGLGAAPIDLEILESASNFLAAMRERRLPPPTGLSPTPAGTVILTWATAPEFMDAEIAEAGLAELMIKNEDGEVIYLEYNTKTGHVAQD